MHDCTGDYYLLNGEQKPVSEFDEAVLQSDDMIYEVMRVEDGITLFIEDYLARLEKTLSMSNVSIRINPDGIRELLAKLIRMNNYTDGPVKLMLSPVTTIAYLMKPYKPEPEEYLSGVKTILLNRERINPNVKYWNPDFRNSVSKALQKHHAFEALLVNRNGEITEGSRSNVFFIRDNELFTTPVHLVLQGITRMKVLEVCRTENIRVIEQIIPAESIGTFESAFLTGTSRKVLAIRQVENVLFQVENELVKRISGMFGQLVKDYIRSHRL
jgi:branched-chain amino acid aminotransferase